MLSDAGYNGHYTIEIEKRLVHAKENYDVWQQVCSD